MRFTPFILSSVALVLAAPSVYAQEGNDGRTLDDQLKRVQQGQPSSVPSDAIREWPGNASTQSDTAPGAMIGSEGAGAIPALPLEVKTAGDITYISGGIGDEDLTQLKATEKDYNLHVLMSMKSGEYISQATMRILDAAGTELLVIEDAGPYVYAQLKPGTYTLEVTSQEDGSKRAKVTVPSKGSVKQHFAF